MQTERKRDWHLPSIGKKKDTAPTEKDVKKLQQQCRETEMMKKSFIKQSEHLILSQQKEINLLKEKQKEMNLKIFLNRSKKHTRKDQENAKKLCELTEAQNKYDRLIEEEKNLISDLDIKIKEKEEDIVKQKRAMSQTKIIRQSQIAQLENQLHHLTQKYDAMNTGNAKLKESINHLRYKKTNFQSLIDKMQQKINSQKESIEKTKEKIMSAHEKKTEIQAETLAFKERAAKDIQKYDIKIEELSRYVDHLDKRKQFMEAKLFDRSAMARRMKQKRQEKRLEKIKNDNQEIIDNYNTICEELGKLFGQQDVDLDRMANQYSFDEMKNDSLFTYVIELYSQEEEIIREIKAIEDEIFNLETNNKNIWTEQLQSIKQQEEKLQETYEATDKYKNKCLEMTRDIKLITTALEDLVKNLNCDISSMEKKLGFEGLTCREKLQYFNILEMKMDELIWILNFCAMRDMTKDSASFTSIDSILAASDVSCSVVYKKTSLPSMPKTIKATDSDVEVLEYEELRKRVLHDLISREKKTKTKKHSRNKYGPSENT